MQPMITSFSETKFRCSACGYVSIKLSALESCKHTPVTEVADVKIGDEVPIYMPKHYKGRAADFTGRNSRYVDITSEPKLVSVTELFYAKEGQDIGHDPYRPHRARHHELCIRLGQSWDRDNDTGYCRMRPWKPGDHSMIKYEFTYRHFLLWRTGDREKLADAGLVLSLSEFRELSKSWWRKLFHIPAA